MGKSKFGIGNRHGEAMMSDDSGEDRYSGSDEQASKSILATLYTLGSSRTSANRRWHEVREIQDSIGIKQIFLAPWDDKAVAEYNDEVYERVLKSLLNNKPPLIETNLPIFDEEVPFFPDDLKIWREIRITEAGIEEVESWPGIGVKRKESKVHTAESNNFPPSPEKVSRKYQPKNQETTGEINKIVEQQKSNRRKILIYLYKRLHGGLRGPITTQDFKDNTGLQKKDIYNALKYLNTAGKIIYSSLPYHRDATTGAFDCPILPEGIREVESWVKLTNETNKKKGQIIKFPTPKGTAWEEIKIKLIDGDTVKISVGKIHKSYSYAQLGLMKVRSGKKTILWKTLVDMAEQGYSDWDTSGADKKVKKRISNLRNILRKVMGLTGDPFFRYNTEKRWQPKFELEDKR